jgi:SMC interacting uncharacterized protein involved in chromosome segregation
MEKLQLKDANTLKEISGMVKTHLDELKNLTADGELVYEITDKKITDIWHNKIKPIVEEMKPAIDAYLEAEKKKETLENEMKALMEDLAEKDKAMSGLNIKKNKFINRISPLILRSLGKELNEYQQFGRIVEENGKVYVTVKDWVGAFLNGYKSKS